MGEIGRNPLKGGRRMFEKRLQVLENSEPEKDWEEILQSNKTTYEQYKKQLNDEDYQRARKTLHSFLPSYFEVFCLINQVKTQEKTLRIDENYDTGIYLVGYSIMPLILSISYIKPSEIIFVVTPDTQPLIDEIKGGINGISPDYHAFISGDDRIRIMAIEDLSDPAAVFQTIDKIIYENEGKKIAIDITGGKKTMVTGAFMASAHSRTCDIFYIDFEEYNIRNSEPVYGTEFLASLPNPSEIFSLADWDRLISLKESYQFNQALKELDNIKENIAKHGKYFSDTFKTRLHELETQIRGLALWDDHCYRQAATYLPEETALQTLQEISDLSDEDILPAKKKIYNNEKYLTLYLLDRLENSRRRKKQGHYQNAFLGFASLLEFTFMIWADMELSEQIKLKYQGTNPNFTYFHLQQYLGGNPNAINQGLENRLLHKLRKIRNDHTLIHNIKVIDKNTVEMAENACHQVVQNLLLKIKKIDSHIVEQDRQAVTF
jgi:hypothetical protein